MADLENTELTPMEAKVLRLKQERAQVRAASGLLKGLIAAAERKASKAADEDVKAATQEQAKLEGELSDSKEHLDALEEAIQEAKEDVRRERRDARSEVMLARQQEQAAAKMMLLAQNIDMVLTAVEAALDDDKAGPRVARIFGKAAKLGAKTAMEIQVAVAEAKASVKAEAKAKAETAKAGAAAASKAAGSPALSTVE